VVRKLRDRKKEGCWVHRGGGAEEQKNKQKQRNIST